MDRRTEWTIVFLTAAYSFATGLPTLPIPNNTAILPAPSGKGGDPVNVYAGFFLESMGNFKSTDMMFDVDLYLRLSWHDKRLRHNQSEEVAIGEKALKKIWIPDLYFPNAREAQFQTVTVTNVGGVILSDGTVALSRRITLAVACNMNLKRYPIDSQDCYIKLSSYSLNTSKLNLTWLSSNPISYNHDIDLPELKIIQIQPAYCNSTFFYPVTEGASTKANFSCLQAHIHLRRSVTYHLVQSYLPTALIVIISWVSFWIDHNAVPARVSLAFTTLLTLSTMGAGLRYALPAVSYAKAIDYWYGICMLFVFAALVEFAAVNSLARKSTKCTVIADKLIGKSVTAEDVKGDAVEFGVTQHPNGSTAADSHFVSQMLLPADQVRLRSVCVQSKSSVDYAEMRISAEMASNFRRKAAQVHDRALAIDRLSRFVFPVVFFGFSTTYWVVYLFI